MLECQTSTAHDDYGITIDKLGQARSGAGDVRNADLARLTDVGQSRTSTKAARELRW
jgi:hypothetical protein